MATIFEAVASANRLNATVAHVFPPQSAVLSQAVANVGMVRQSQFSVLSQAIAKTYQPLFDAVLARDEISRDSLSTKSVSSTSGGPQRLADREIAAMLTVVAFLMVYISFGLLIKYNRLAANLAVTYGPTPFEAAMAVGAFVFWLWMNRSGGSSRD